MSKTDDEGKTTATRKPYEKPTATKLTAEQARLKLLGCATMGDQGAADLLSMLFPRVPQKESTPKRKSA